MSTFAVFGMVRSVAVEIARKRVVAPSHWTATQWEERVQYEADTIMAGDKVVQVSDFYDSPTPAFDYAKRLRDQGGRDVRVRARKRELQADGQTYKTHWVDYNESEISRGRRS